MQTTKAKLLLTRMSGLCAETMEMFTKAKSTQDKVTCIEFGLKLIHELVNSYNLLSTAEKKMDHDVVAAIESMEGLSSEAVEKAFQLTFQSVKELQIVVNTWLSGMGAEK